MSASAAADTARQALWMLAGQLAVALLLALAGVVVWNPRTALSLLAGGGIGIAGSTYVVIQLWRSRVRPGGGGLVRIFAAWLIKVAMVLSLLFLTLRSGAFVPPAVLGGLAAGLIWNWIWLSVDRTSTRSFKDGN